MIVEGSYDKIRSDALSFVNEKLSNDVSFVDVVMSVGIFLSFTRLEDLEKEDILYEVIDICEYSVNQKRINVEENSAIKDVLNTISPY